MAKKKKNSIQKLIGFETFTKYGVKTDKCEFVFFHVEPTNISVLSADNIDAKVHHLMMLLSMIPELEIIALDSCECFDTNKSYVRKRLKDARFDIDDFTDFDKLNSEDYPTVLDLYKLTEKEYMAYDREKRNLYTEEMLQNICLGLHSMCKGAESKYFNGHTNIRDGEFICFGVKGLMDTNKRLKDTLLFNILSFMSNQLLGKGNTVAAVDELYLFLTNMTAIEYIRNGMKRVRKKESSFILASQNIEDFLLPEIKEFTKPLFSIPSHSFLFFPGNISPTEYMDALQLVESEYRLIQYAERGTCVYRCGNERYLLQVHAPAHKEIMFGKAGGR